METGDSIERAVTGNVEFQLEGLDLSDGVVIIAGNVSKSLSTGKSVSENNSLFKRKDGTYIPVPDEDKKAIFYATDITLNSTTIRFKKLKLDDDFKINSDEYPGRTGVEEEFYYLNFYSPKWKDLDRSEVVFWLAGVGHYSCSLLHWNLMGKEYNTKKIFNFSSSYFNSGLGIDLYAVLSGSDEFRLYVLNPIELNENDAISIDGNRGG